MQKDISFYSLGLARQITGNWSLFGEMLTVTAWDGRQKTTQLGGSSPESLAHLMLVELEMQTTGKQPQPKTGPVR